MTKFFDLHFEVGDVSAGIFYAKTILGNNAVKFEHQGPTPGAAIMACIADMEGAGMWGIIASNPAMTPYPFPGPGQRNSGVTTTTAATTVPAKKQADPVRVRSFELGTTPKGQCESLCITHDNFGSVKCGSFCPGKQ
jgi:hypothetical protein